MWILFVKFLFFSIPYYYRNIPVVCCGLAVRAPAAAAAASCCWWRRGCCCCTPTSSFVHCRTASIKKHNEHTVVPDTIDYRATIIIQHMERIQQLEIVVKEGIDALFKLGVLFHEGTEIAQDIPKAIEYYSKAAGLGHIGAQIKLAVYYYQNGDLVKGVEYYLQAAVNGSSEAQFQLGLRFKSGEGILPDRVQMEHWWRKAISQGHSNSMYHLGVYFHELDQISPSLDYREESKVLIEKAALSGNVDACQFLQQNAEPIDMAIPQDGNALFNFGVSYILGQTCPKDVNMAILCYEKAAALGHSMAQFNLGVHYSVGLDGVSMDKMKGEFYYHQSAKNNNAMAMYNYGVILHERGKSEDNVNVMHQGISWLVSAAENGYRDSKLYMAIRYRNGSESVPLDEQKALQWLAKAAEEGSADAWFWLGVTYVEGRGVKKDINSAVICYKEAASLGHRYAQYNLGLTYYSGLDGFPADKEEGLKYLLQAAQNGHVDAMYYYGAYSHESGRRQQNQSEMAKGVEWIEKAANSGHVESMYWMGVVYVEGNGVVSNAHIANEWYQKAVAHGHNQAMNNLGWSYLQPYGYEQDKIKAKQLFEAAVANGNVVGYMGLAEIVRDNKNEHIDYLIKAADSGVHNGWQQLKPYCHDPYLRMIWNTSKIVRLMEMISADQVSNGTINGTTDSVGSDGFMMCADPDNCVVCQAQAKLILREANRGQIIESPSTHISPSIFGEIMISDVTIKGGQGEVKFVDILLGNNSMPLALKKVKVDNNTSAARTNVYQTVNSIDYFIEEELIHLRLLQNCSYILKCYGHTVLHNELYLVMERATYGDLKSFLFLNPLQEFSKDSFGLSIQWMLDIARGLQFMHDSSNAIVHAD